MTITEAPPQPAAPPSPAGAPAASGNWLTTADHRRVGILFLAAAFAFLVGGGIAGMVVRAELMEPGGDLVGGRYDQWFSLHTTTLAVLFLAPAWVGLATCVVPPQVGTTRLAFPRLQPLALWTYVCGGVLAVVSYAMTDGPRGLGITTSRPLPAGEPSSAGTDVWVLSLVLVAVASVLAAANLAVTVLKFRAPGLTLRRVPYFTWSTLVTSISVLIATPAFIAGLVIVYLDQHYGGRFFENSATAQGGLIVWKHLIWLFGRPESHLLMVPALGVASDVVEAHGRRPLVNGDAARGLIAAAGILGFTAWAAGTKVINADVVPHYSNLTKLALVPVALLGAMWLDTLRRSTPRLHASLLYVGGMVVLLAFGALNLVGQLLDDSVGGAWGTGHVHVVVFGAPLVALFAGVYHWAPRIWGRQLSTGVGAVQLLLLVGGLVIAGGAEYLLGLDEAPRHVQDLGDKSSWTNLSRLAGVGGGLVLLAVVVFALNFFNSIARRQGAEVAADE